MDTNRWHRSIDEHREAVLATARRLPTQTVALDDALGLVLADDVIATVSVPAAAVSAMDGFAVRHADVAVGAVLPVTMDIPVGSVAPHPLEPGTAARIMTGAVVPEGADSVVAVELTDVPRGPVPLPREITIQQQVPFADAVRDAGSDVAAGQVVAPAGSLLDAFAVGALAAVGIAQVDVVPAPRVRVVSTGAELRQPGQVLAPGQIYDSNSHALAACALQAGCVVDRVVLEHDRPDDLAAALPDLLAEVDAVIFSGGVSAGAFEVVRQTLSERGVEFGTVAMQPGKPQGVGVVDGVAVFCLPGNPVSAMVSFMLFVEPWLAVAAGTPPRGTVPVPVDDVWTKKAGRAQVMPVVLGPDGVRRRSPEGSQSHLVTRLVGIDGWAVVPAETTEVRRGDVVDVMMVL